MLADHEFVCVRNRRIGAHDMAARDIRVIAVAEVRALRLVTRLYGRQPVDRNGMGFEPSTAPGTFGMVNGWLRRAA